MPEVRRYPDARAFLARAEPWLLEAEIERAGPLASARQAFANESRYPKPTYWATVEDEGKIIGCAYRTPPYRVGVTALPMTALAPLALDLEQAYRTISGVAGIDPAASALADVWIARHGGKSAIVSRQFLLTLPDADADAAAAAAPAADPQGTLRAAEPRDAALARGWGTEYARETGMPSLDGNLCAGLIGARQLYLFEASGAPRCMLGVLQQTPRAAALGIAYTPPADRKRGYATAAVAALAVELRERAIPRRFVYIDPANAGAQALCRKLGCELVQASVDIDFR